MKRNLKLVAIAFIVSIPFWWGIDILSDTATKVFLSWELKTNPEILKAYAAQDNLEKKLEEAYPLPKKGTDKLLINARAVHSILVKENEAQKPLFQQNPDSPVLIASLTKLMTAFVAVQSYSPLQEIVITPEIILAEGKGGQLKQWETFTVRDLLYIALIESSNDAAEALMVPLGAEIFIEKMNTQAALINMNTASFANPTGLDASNANYASAQDLTKLGIHLKNNYPQVFDILSQQQFPVRTSNGKFHHNLINTNELLGYKDWPTKVLGGKTGWTPAAKQSLLLIVESPDRKGYIVSVILGSDDRFGEMKKLLSWILHSYQWNQ